MEESNYNKIIINTILIGIGMNGNELLDHGSHQEFVDYYAKQSLNEATNIRMKNIFNCILRNLEDRHIEQKLDILDIGCGSGVMSMMSARKGHVAHGLDINEPLLEIARQRAKAASLTIDFRLGSAACLPWQNNSMDVCIAPELLEHVADWESCIQEFARVIRPNGILFISTSNKLCPKQEEFNLPFYSWYPCFLKRHFENLAKTTRPDLVNFATYPAVNWFSFFQLKKYLATLNLDTYDRFDVMNLSEKSYLEKSIVKLIRNIPALRWLAHLATPSLSILAIKRP